MEAGIQERHWIPEGVRHDKSLALYDVVVYKMKRP